MDGSAEPEPEPEPAAKRRRTTVTWTFASGEPQQEDDLADQEAWLDDDLLSLLVETDARDDE